MKTPLFRPLGVLLGLSWLFTGLVALAEAPPKPVLVVFETELGRITVAVDVGRAPVTSANFLRYVDGKYYDGAIINRAVRPDNTIRHDVEIQVIQLQENPERHGEMFPAIPLERTSVTGLRHLDGTISMARSGPDTAQAAFFITIGPQPSLDFGGRRNADGQGFAAFGQVIAGMDVVKRIQNSPSAAQGEYGTETLSPPIRILKAYRTGVPQT